MPPDGIQAAASPVPSGAADWGALPDVESLRPGLWRLAYRFCWNAADADDVVQDALIRAAARRGQLSEAGRLEAWLRSIVVRRCQELRREAARRRGRERARPAASADGMGKGAVRDAAAVLLEAEFNEALKDAIQRLPERQQTAIVLRHLEGLEYEEIAEIMQINAGTVRAQVRDAREALRRAMFA